MDITALVASVGGTVTACFLGYLYYRYEMRTREFQHAERLAALESGRPLPDAETAQATVEINRAWAAILVGLLVPAVMAGAALGGTVLVFRQDEPKLHLPLVCVIWGVCGLVSMVTAICALGSMHRKRDKRERAEEATPGRERIADVPAAVAQ